MVIEWAISRLYSPGVGGLKPGMYISSKGNHQEKLGKSGQVNVIFFWQVAIFGVILPFYKGQKWVNIFTNRSGQAGGG